MHNKWKNLSMPVRASLVYMMVSILHLGIGFITSPIYTRLMSETDYGTVSVYNSYFSVVGVVAMYCLNYGFFDNAMHKYKDDRNVLTFSILVLSALITTGTYLLCILFKVFVPQIISLNWQLLHLLFLTFLLQPAYNLWISRQRYEYKYQASGLISGIVFFLSPVFAVLCIIKGIYRDDVINRLWGGYIPFYVVYVCMYIYVAFQAKGVVNRKYWKEALRFNTPLIPHYLSLYMLSSSDKIMIEYFNESADVAYYSIAATIASAGTIVWTAINSSLVPYTYSRCDHKDYKSINKVTMPLILLNACVCIVIMLFAPEFLRVLAPASYKEALRCIPPLIGGAFFTSLYHVFANIIYYYEKTKYVMVASFVSATSNILLNIFLIPRVGFLAAAYTTLFCYILQAVIDFSGMKKAAGDNVYSVNTLFVISCIVIVPAIFIGKIYTHIIFRYMIIAAFLIILFVFKKRVIGIVNMIRNS